MAKTRQFFTADRDRALLSIIQAANRQNIILGTREFFHQAKMLSPSTRVGSPLTLQRWIERAEENAWIGRISTGRTGRGNKSEYKLTSIGEGLIKAESVGSLSSDLFPTSSPELGLLKSLHIVPDPERALMLFANTSLAPALKNRELRDKLEKLQDAVDDVVGDIEDTLADESVGPDLTPEEWRKRHEDYKLLEERFRFLAHRHEYVLGRIKHKATYRKAILSHDLPGREIQKFDGVTQCQEECSWQLSYHNRNSEGCAHHS